MSEIKCPNCGKTFDIDGDDYSQIVSQVRDETFKKELDSRSRLIEEKHKSDIEAMKAKMDADSDKEVSALKTLIKELETRLAGQPELVKAKVSEASVEADKEIARLKQELEGERTRTELAVSQALEKKKEELAKRESEIVELSGKVKERELALASEREKQKAQYEAVISLKDEQIAQLKDMRMKLSTKMVGETLEQHCLNEFNALRATGFKNSYFEKDNDSSSGSKGDFVFRDYSDDGTEFISIMFEMKNENETTATKHKNEDFLKELDKDRTEKKCEYAVLVSMLEADSELYNNGIVDVSHKYQKMFVIRPQFFIPMITLLRNAALDSLEYKKEMIAMRNENIDIAHFEEDLNDFRDKFNRNYRLASEKFKDAVKRIDDTIVNLGKIRDGLLSSENNLRLANERADTLSVKSLTKKNPTMKAKFEEVGEKDKDEG